MSGDGDGWTTCSHGHRHWGRFGAAGLLIHRVGPETDDVLLQLRSPRSHLGGTWGVPGGALDSHEDPVAAAVREAGEEVGLTGDLRVRGQYVADHGGWSYTTVVASAVGTLSAAPSAWETIAVAWVPVIRVTQLELHPGFAAAWPELMQL